jgi:protease-4
MSAFNAPMKKCLDRIGQNNILAKKQYRRFFMKTNYAVSFFSLSSGSLRRLALISLLLISILLVGCITININPFGPITSPPKTKLTNNTVLHFTLSGQITEYRPQGEFSLFGGGNTDSLHDIIQKIRSAKTDSRIKSILLQPRYLSIGLSNINELHAALNDFKSSGKKVYGYISVASQSDILLLSVADEVYMNPSASAGFALSGIGGNILFFRDMLDKLGVQMHIIRAGEYKSAGEQFTRNSMSIEFHEDINALFSDIYERLLDDFATGYDILPDRIRYIFEQRDKFTINLNDAVSYGFVDELIHFEDLLEKLRIPRKQLVNHRNYAPVTTRTQRDRIALVYMLGDITPHSGAFSSAPHISAREYVRIFDDILNDDNIKAVVIRIDSGGGSALESEIIYHKLTQLREKKPVVVSMGNVAASGGYYIAVNAHHIVADPYTITGSIGVVSMLPNLEVTGQKIGLSSESVGFGKFATSGDPFSPIDPGFMTAMQISVDEIYHEFKSRVSQARRLSMEHVDDIAKGRMWSAQMALHHELIDEIGLLDDAINKAVELSKVGNYTLTPYPDKRASQGLNLGFRLGAVSPTLQLAELFSEQAQDFIALYNDIKESPIQMRAEIISFWDTP